MRRKYGCTRTYLEPGTKQSALSLSASTSTQALACAPARLGVRVFLSSECVPCFLATSRCLLIGRRVSSFYAPRHGGGGDFEAEKGSGAQWRRKCRDAAAFVGHRIGTGVFRGHHNKVLAPKSPRPTYPTPYARSRPRGNAPHRLSAPSSGSGLNQRSRGNASRCRLRIQAKMYFSAKNSMCVSILCPCAEVDFNLTGHGLLAFSALRTNAGVHRPRHTIEHAATTRQPFAARRDDMHARKMVTQLTQGDLVFRYSRWPVRSRINGHS
jgi:hypothetical protein